MPGRDGASDARLEGHLDHGDVGGDVGDSGRGGILAKGRDHVCEAGFGLLAGFCQDVSDVPDDLVLRALHSGQDGRLGWGRPRQGIQEVLGGACDNGLDLRDEGLRPQHPSLELGHGAHELGEEVRRREVGQLGELGAVLGAQVRGDLVGEGNGLRAGVGDGDARSEVDALHVAERLHDLLGLLGDHVGVALEGG